MTTLAELVAELPDPSHGRLTQHVDGPGVWRWCVELADPAAGAAVTWHDVTGLCVGVTNEFGADQPRGRAMAGVSTLVFRAADDRLSVMNTDTSPTFGVHVELGHGLIVRAGYFRVSGGVTVEERLRFTHRVEEWFDGQAADGRYRRHEVIARDLGTDLAGQPVTAAVSENWPARVVHVLDGWEFPTEGYGAETYDDGGPQPVLTLPARDESTDAGAELDATLDPAGLVWHTLPNGTLRWRPRADDTFHAGHFEDPATTGTPWVDPATTVFSYRALDDNGVGFRPEPRDGNQSFGFGKSEYPVINNLAVSDPVGPEYDDDDPVSIERAGWRRRRLSWQAKNDAVAAAMLATLANASVIARPLVTDHRLPGFFTQACKLRWLDPIAIRHQSRPGAAVQEGTGRVRTIREDITPKPGRTEHRMVVSIDVDVSTFGFELNPPTDVAVSGVTDTHADFTWTNPAQPVAPTHTQVRVDSGIWLTVGYPITALAWDGLEPSTNYQFDVRYIREVDGRIVAVSPQSNVEFTTDEGVTIGDGDATLPDDGCETIEWELQESDDGVTWTTVASGTGEPGETITLPNELFQDDHLYRLRTDCNGEGTLVHYSPVFDPPDDWEDPCTTPAQLAGAPYDDESLVLFVPQVCAYTVRDAVSGVEVTKGPAWGGITASDTEGDWALLADTANGGVVCAGELGTEFYGSATIGLRYSAQNGGDQRLMSIAGLRIDQVDGTTGWYPRASVTTELGDEVVLTDPTERSLIAPRDVFAGYNADTGLLDLTVDGVTVASGAVEEAALRARQGTGWYIGAAAASWITNAAVWSTGIDVVAPLDPYADDFNRPNDTDIGEQWAEDPGYAGLAITDNKLTGAGEAVWLTELTDDMFAEVDILSAPAQSGINLRANPADFTQKYFVLVLPNTGPTLRVFRYGASTTQILSSNAWPSGQTGRLRVEIVGGAIDIYRNGALIDSVTDGSPLTGEAYAGVRTSGASAALDNWECGPL